MNSILTLWFLIVVFILPDYSFSKGLNFFNRRDHRYVQFISIDGLMDENVNQQIKSINRKKILKDTRALYFVLDNEGGYKKDLDDFVNSIFGLAKFQNSKTNLPLYVVVENFCISLCIHAFAKLSDLSNKSPSLLKVATSQEALFGFHAATIIFGMRSLEANEQSLLILRKYGLSEDWINSNKSVFETTKVSYFKAKDLVNSGAGIIKKDQLL